MYCDRKTLDKIYGKININLWADLDNTGDSEQIEERITFMIEQSQALLDGRLALSAYSTPFEEPVPTVISYICGLQAGILLFNGRRIVSDENEGQVSAQRTEFETYINRILSDTLVLPVTRNSTRPIKVVQNQDTSESSINASYPKAFPDC